MSATLERLARACILPGFAGKAAPEWLRRELDAGLGGVVLFARNVRDPEQLRALTASIRVSPETVVAIDEEGGDVTRLEAARGSSVPGALALGAVDDVALTESVALAVAVALREAGITHDLAPVADVNTNPLNPVIGVRSFGSDPALVARHVAAFTVGLQEGGVAACAKHFPGPRRDGGRLPSRAPGRRGGRRGSPGGRARAVPGRDRSRHEGGHDRPPGRPRARRAAGDAQPCSC